jgi:hypothetical protein
VADPPIADEQDAAPDLVDPRHFGLDEDETLLPEASALEVRRGRSLARQDLKKLLALGREARLARVEQTESRRSFRSRALAELLLGEGRRQAGRDPEEAEHLARVAQAVVHWIPGPPGERWREVVRARAAAHRANALRVAGRLHEADLLFQGIHERVLRRDLESPALLAEAAGWEAALRWRQGRGGEAARLLAWSADGHRRAGARLGLVRCLVRWGEVLRSQGDAGGAVDRLEWAAKLTEPAALTEHRPGVLLRLGQALCDAGRDEEARGPLRGARPEEGGGGAEDGLRAAEVAWLAGRVDASPRRLGEARDGLALAGWPGEAALAGLDLVGLLLPHAAAGPLEKACRALRRLAGGGGLTPRVAEWVGLAAERLDPGAEPEGGAGAEAARAVARAAESLEAAYPGAAAVAVGGPPGPETFSLLRRGLLREVSLASWGAW